MKFVHIADIHFDTVFSNLSSNSELCKLRRVDVKESFRKVIEYIKENNIPYLFIAGDLYEHKYIRESTIIFINNLFKTIPNTKIFISPGNHDPYLKNSFYNNFLWNNNVYIFKSKIEKIELDDVNIYGYGFSDFYSETVNLSQIKIEDKNKLNILLIHGTLDGSDAAEKMYNPISRKKIEEIGFDYVALGHIHKNNINEIENNKIIYPGSMISLGFDEQGEHGMVVGELNKSEFKINFIKVDEKQFAEKDIDISEIYSMEELIDKINNMNIFDNIYYKINLIGKRKFEINIIDLKKLIENINILKIKNKTKMDYNLESISQETTLRGMFAKEILERISKMFYIKIFIMMFLK